MPIMFRSASCTVLLMIAVLNDGSLFLPSAAPIPDKYQTGMFTTAAPLNPVSDVNRLARYANMGLTQTPVQRTQPISQVHPDAAPFVHINSADVANRVPSFNSNNQAGAAASGTGTQPNVSGMSAPGLPDTNNAMLNNQPGMTSSGGATQPIKVSGMSAPVSSDTANPMSNGSGMMPTGFEADTGTSSEMPGFALGTAGNEQMSNSVKPATAGSDTSPPGPEGAAIGSGTPGMNSVQGPPSSTSSETSGTTGSVGNEQTPSSMKPVTPASDTSAPAPEGAAISGGNLPMNAPVPPASGTGGSGVDQFTGGTNNQATPQGAAGWPTQRSSSGQETELISSAGQGSGPSVSSSSEIGSSTGSEPFSTGSPRVI